MFSSALLAIPTWLLALIIVVAAALVACFFLGFFLAWRKRKSSVGKIAAEPVAEKPQEVPAQPEEVAPEKPEVPEDKPEEVEDKLEKPDSVLLEEVKEEKAEEVKPANPIIVKRAAGGKVFIRVRYNRSYTAKLIQSSDETKDYYSEIKNELSRYKVSNRTSWKYETFRKGRKLLVKLAVRGKSLYIYFALDPARYADTKYKINDVSDVVSNAEVPTLYKIKNARRCRYAKQLIADVMAENGLIAGEESREDYAAKYPYEPIEPLIERQLVKVFEYEEAKPDTEVGIIAVPEEVLNSESHDKLLIRVRYNRSYTAKLIQSPEVTKNYYSIIKNELLRYKVSSRISWKHETFRRGRKLLVKLAVRGKSLYVYFALDPARYADTKYKVNDVSDIASNAEVPTLYKIKNDRRCRYAKQLIADVMAENGLVAGEERSEDYVSQYPYEETEPLIERKLIKLLPWKERATGSEVGVIEVEETQVTEEIAAATEPGSVPEHIAVTVAEAEEQIPDEEVESYVQQSTEYSDKTKRAVINIDTLARHFNDGETVTLEEIKKRVKQVAGNVTYIKVLARGKLDKTLTVVADDFSPTAVKMIVLTGGSAVRKKAAPNN